MKSKDSLPLPEPGKFQPSVRSGISTEDKYVMMLEMYLTDTKRQLAQMMEVNRMLMEQIKMRDNPGYLIDKDGGLESSDG